MLSDTNSHMGLFKASDADCDVYENCPCCGNTERLLREQIRSVSVIVSTPFHESFTQLIGPALGEIRLRGGELLSFSPQRRQTVEFAHAVRKFEAAVAAYCAALRTIDGLEEGGSNIPQSDLQRALALRRALISMVRYAGSLVEEASTLGKEP